MDPTDQQGNDQFSRPEPQVVKPEDMFNPSVSAKPPAPEPIAPPPTQSIPQPSTGSADFAPFGNGNRKKILIIIGTLVGIFILVLIIVLITSSGGNNKQNNQTDQTSQTSGILNPPAAIDIENANNSISSDITGLNDDNDFPTANLSDDNLQL